MKATGATQTLWYQHAVYICAVEGDWLRLCCPDHLRSLRTCCCCVRPKRATALFYDASSFTISKRWPRVGQFDRVAFQNNSWGSDAVSSKLTQVGELLYIAQCASKRFGQKCRSFAQQLLMTRVSHTTNHLFHPTWVKDPTWQATDGPRPVTQCAVHQTQAWYKATAVSAA